MVLQEEVATKARSESNNPPFELSNLVPELVMSRNNMLQLPLHIACMCGNLTLVKELTGSMKYLRD